MLKEFETTKAGLQTHFVIESPQNISGPYKRQMLDLIDLGGQVKRERAEIGIENAALIGLTVLEGKVIATCCLKNPFPEYKQQVFMKAKAGKNLNLYCAELGYITTHPDFEGEGYCQQLLKEFFCRISHLNMFATTRKPAMRHILEKYRFYQRGIRYGDGLDLELMLYDAKKLPSCVKSNAFKLIPLS